MTVYNINLGIGWASSGVEYAQAYRASVFKDLGIDTQFVFTDLFRSENLAHFTENMGFSDENVTWLYQAFSDIKTAPTTFTLSDIKKSLSFEPTKTEEGGNFIRFIEEQRQLRVTYYFVKDSKEFVHRVEHVSRGVLVRKDFYSYTRVFSEYYFPKNNVATVYLRTFYNEDGSIAFEELVDGDKSTYRFKDKLFFDKYELLGHYLDSLQLTSKDIILLDRGAGTAQAVFRHKGAAKLAVVIHAEHFSPNSVTDHTILWNNFYEYQFVNSDMVDAYIVSTKRQKEVLAEQFATFHQKQPTIYVIPVGSIDKLRHAENNRKPYSLVTASRLATEKHIDWLVEAVLLAKEEIPELTFDIYGEGGQRKILQEIIDKAQAQDFIQLKGHQNMTEVYQNYEAYLAGSTSEGFGLTLLEAIGGGLPIIGLDVRYGNQTFIDDGQNGYLIPRQEPDDAGLMARAFAEKIVTLFKEADLRAFHEHSYAKADPYLNAAIEKRWLDFMEEVTHDC
ncbi:TPA: accessory Sec system glycosyltransferase GtfA [Streptococcus agalactiae]